MSGYAVRVVGEQRAGAGQGLVEQRGGRRGGYARPQVRGQGRAVLRAAVHGEVRDDPPGVRLQRHGVAVRGDGEGTEHRDAVQARAGSSLIDKHGCPRDRGGAAVMGGGWCAVVTRARSEGPGMVAVASCIESSKESSPPRTALPRGILVTFT